jgi:hypothetical protein
VLDIADQGGETSERGHAAQPVGNVETTMDFIESLFGVSPDGGDGSLEVVWLVAIVAAAVAIGFRRRILARFASRPGKKI